MDIEARAVRLWRAEVEDRPGVLSSVLARLREAGADLQVVMGYKLPGARGRAVLELWPVVGRRRQEIARGAGFAPSATPTLHVTGEDRAGLGAVLTAALAEAGIDLAFLVAQTAGRGYSAVFGFGSGDDARRGAAAMRRAARRSGPSRRPSRSRAR